MQTRPASIVITEQIARTAASRRGFTSDALEMRVGDLPDVHFVHFTPTSGLTCLHMRSRCEPDGIAISATPEALALLTARHADLTAKANEALTAFLGNFEDWFDAGNNRRDECDAFEAAHPEIPEGFLIHVAERIARERGKRYM